MGVRSYSIVKNCIRQSALGWQVSDVEAEIDNIVSAVEDRIYSLGESEVNSKQIGDFVLDELANRNEVAYVRFASVYREFKSADEFVKVLDELRHSRSNGKE